jgi:hypothetical protein
MDWWGYNTKPHWAFISPEKSVPDADKDFFVTNRNYYFTFAKMRSKGMKQTERSR